MLVVGAAIVDDLVRPTRLLAARRTGPAALAGGWELPGGKLDGGERPEDALRRELREELAIEVEIGDEVVAATRGPGFPVTAPGGEGDDAAWGGAWPLPPLDGADVPRGLLRVWRARVTSGEVTLGPDHDAARWLGEGEWFDVPWLAVDLPIVRALVASTGG